MTLWKSFTLWPLTNNYEKADKWTKMIHKGKVGSFQRVLGWLFEDLLPGLVQVQSKDENAKNTSTCDSMLIGDKAAANTYPYIVESETYMDF